MKKLTEKQKYHIINTSYKRDFCIKTHGKTMNSLVKKGLAFYTSGFGWNWGALIQLNEKGIRTRKLLLLKNERG